MMLLFFTHLRSVNAYLAREQVALAVGCTDAIRDCAVHSDEIRQLATHLDEIRTEFVHFDRPIADFVRMNRPVGRMCGLCADGMGKDGGQTEGGKNRETGTDKETRQMTGLRDKNR